MHHTERSAHVFASHLILSELDLNEGLDCGEELPPWPVLHTTVLVDVFLDAADGQILNLKNTYREIVTTEKHVQECRETHTERHTGSKNRDNNIFIVASCP